MLDLNCQQNVFSPFTGTNPKQSLYLFENGTELVYLIVVEIRGPVITDYVYQVVFPESDFGLDQLFKGWLYRFELPASSMAPLHHDVTATAGERLESI